MGIGQAGASGSNTGQLMAWRLERWLRTRPLGAANAFVPMDCGRDGSSSGCGMSPLSSGGELTGKGETGG